ncbi:hypothetical protein, unknown function [Leishmania tarentolae]|uniref:Uncharacterized protein n=1 Tax=Leishmania tarentolae TaxID=5689 RepID=A0A640KC22_LEITA|nr:hypothetical protein, unknown function [Leishmania tarentolae]
MLMLQRSATSLFSFLTSGSTRRSRDGGTKRSRDGGTADSAAANDVVKVQYASNLVLHYHGSSDSFSLTSNNVQLVPYPLVPPPVRKGHGEAAAPQPVDVIGKKEDRGEKADNRIGAASDKDTDPTITVTIPKGKVRYAVPHRTVPHTPTHGWDHFYIALNLWKNEKVLPDLTEALIVFLEEEVKPFFDLATSVVVSIYANISPDRTSELITTTLIPRLHAAGVRTVYATVEGACLGYVERQSFHERIEWMACIRNKALAPLYEKGMNVFASPQQQQQQQQQQAATGADGGADRLVVLFFNDVVFRPQDITSLLESRVEAQIANVEPHGWVSSGVKKKVEFVDPGVVNDIVDSKTQRVGTASTSPSAATSTGAGTTFDMACGMDFYATFYDTWVTRDRLGKPFGAQMPYSDDHATQEAFYRIFNHERSGDYAPRASAIPVKCCWNGVAAIRGRFFLAPSPLHRLGFPVRDAAETTAQTSSAASSVLAATGSARREAAGSLPDGLQHPSGAVYDRIGDVHDLLSTTTLAHYYKCMLALRLQSVCGSWRLMSRILARATDTPFYVPEACDSNNNFTDLLQSVDREMSQPSAADADWVQLRLQREGHTLFPDIMQDVTSLEASAVDAESEADVESAVSMVPRVEEDSIYYRARHPSVRFRHAFTPSYGAAVAGHAPVRDDVCLASECLLICQDVMHAALLQDKRVPVILLNPHVRVGYNLKDFNRVTQQTWFFENPHVYWLWTLARRAQLWWSSSSSSIQEKGGLRVLGNATSAMDDWLRNASVVASSGTVMQGTQQLSVQDGAGRVKDTGLIDIPTLTRMDCHKTVAGSIRVAMGAFFPVVRVGKLLLAVLALRWMCSQAQMDVSIDPPSNKGVIARAYSLEVQWWRALHGAVRYSWLAQRLRRLAVGVAGGEQYAGDGSRMRAVTSFSSALLKQLRRLQSHRFAKNLPGRSCVRAVWVTLYFVVQTLMWLLRTLCCVPFGVGCCQTPRRSKTSAVRSSGKLRQLWQRRGSGSWTAPHYRRGSFPSGVPTDDPRACLTVAGEAGNYTAAGRSEEMTRPIAFALSIPRSLTATGGGGSLGDSGDDAEV